jgi:hypothetical protein
MMEWQALENELRVTHRKEKEKAVKVMVLRMEKGKEKGALLALTARLKKPRNEH